MSSIYHISSKAHKVRNWNKFFSLAGYFLLLLTLKAWQRLFRLYYDTYRINAL